MLKRLKKFRPSTQSDREAVPSMTDLEPADTSSALASADMSSKRARIIGILQILLVLLLMAVAVY